MNTLPENTLKTRVPQEEVKRVVKPAPSRYRNEIAKYIVHRSLDCKRCGKCLPKCPNKIPIIEQLAETAELLG